MEATMLATPTRTQIASAMNVVQSPDLFADKFALRAFAWATLMATRGQRVNQLRIGQMQRAQRLGNAAAASCAPVQIAIRQGA
jgi:hypothetical protein